jgi:hypothetical protein
MNFEIRLIGWRGNMLIIIVGVQKTPERREFNVMRVVKRVNNDFD